MLYVINGKYYVNIAPSIYVEVLVTKDGDVTPTSNKIEVNANTPVVQVSLKDIIKNIKTEPVYVLHETGQKNNRRKR